jgi:hypothetical protein
MSAASSTPPASNRGDDVAAQIDDNDYVYAPPTTRKAKDGCGTRQELLTFARAMRYAVEVEYIDGGEPPLWLRNGYDNAREITGLDRECWPAPWERGDGDA